MKSKPAIRVALADDHPSLRAGLCARLGREDDIVVVGEAGTGQEALQLVANMKPHVLLLDMEMPDLSGVEVARRLKAAKVPVRILALSAHDDDEYILELLDSGAAGYLIKHEPLETILAAVRGVAAGEEGWLSRDVASALIRSRRSRRELEEDPVRLLSEREREVVHYLAQGESNQQIGENLFISTNTVKKHVNNIYYKLEVSSRAEAVAWAWRHGLVETDRH